MPHALEAQRVSGDGPRVTEPSAAASDEAEVFLSTIRAIKDFALTTYADSTLWEKAIEGLIKELGDPYAAVLTPDQVAEFEEESTGNYAGIGVQITELNERVTITAVFRGTPAYEAGLMVGDRIVEVDGEDAREWTVDRASSRIRGEPGSTVRVSVLREGISQPMPNEIRRERVHIPAVTAERIFGGVGYLVLDRVARNSANEVDSVLTRMDGAPGLIFDLRGNPGGYLDESLRLADLFLDRGSVVVSTRSRNPGDADGVSEEAAYSRLRPRLPEVPVVVLVDRFSASAAEIVAGALQDHDRALVLGERTFGKGSVQSVVPLPAGRLLRLTSGEWYTPLGRSLNRPRDRDGATIDPDSIAEFTSAAGRILYGGGGVFPDLEVPNDTLTSEEQSFVGAALEAEIPLSVRIHEAALDGARLAQQAGGEAGGLPEPAYERFETGLLEAGMAPDAFTDPIREYLRWRIEVVYFERIDRRDRALEVRAQRDPVLAMAVELLEGSASQSDLFARAASMRATDRAERRGIGGG
jgi:carboxyl-terminal processing protease